MKPEEQLQQCERFRREQRSYNTDAESAELDAGEALCYMLDALNHLRESVPNGQRVRTAAAVNVLRHGLWDLQLWLLRKGVRT
jgi:hypothetical protein